MKRYGLMAALFAAVALVAVPPLAAAAGAVAAVVQTETPPSLLETIISGIVAVLLPAISAFLAVQIAKANTSMDGWSATAKQVVAFVVALVAAQLTKLLGVQFPAELAAYGNPDVVQGVLAGFASWLIHKLIRGGSTTPAKA